MAEKIKKSAEEYQEEEDQWASLVQIKTFLNEALKHDSLFCCIHKMKESCRLMKIEIEGWWW